MQGDEAEQSISGALDTIYAREDFFDVVVIIRGGGAQSELNCFNSYWLASHICQFPLPVLTGIGHEQDETIADLVAHTRLKTPTAVAEFLLNQFRVADERINELSLAISDLVSERVTLEKERLYRIIMTLKPVLKERLTTSSGDLRYLGIKLNGSVRQLLIRKSGIIQKKNADVRTGIREYLNKKRHALEILERKNSYLDPFLILKRGYSVTYYQGKPLRNPSVVDKNEVLETRLAEGNIKSKTF